MYIIINLQVYQFFIKIQKKNIDNNGSYQYKRRIEKRREEQRRGEKNIEEKNREERRRQ